MNKLWILLRVQLLGEFGINKTLHSGNKKDKNKLVGFFILFVFIAASLLFSLVMYDFIFIDAFSKIGVPELMPAMMMAMASVITLFTTIYKTNGLLFGFKDYDMTMELPVKTNVVVASRLVMLYLMNLGFCVLVTVPAGIVYAFFVMPPLWFYAGLFVLLFFVPMVPMIVGTALGSLITAVSTRFRHANIVNIALTLVLILGAMGLSFSIPAVFTNTVAVSQLLSGAIYGIYPLTRMYTEALCGGNVVSMLLFVLISLALFVGFAVVLGRFYKRINTALTTSRSRANYRMTALKVSPPLVALYRRELRRYFSSSLYVLNTAIGMVMALLMSGSLLFLKPDQLEAMLEIPGFAGVIGDLAPMVLAVLVSMSCTTSCAVSLEGTSLWVVKSLPVKADVIFAAKVLVNLTVTVPLSVLCAVLMAVALPMNAAQIILLLLTPIAFAVLIAEFGLFLNLLYPNFTWTSEVVVVKQSMPMMVSVLGGMVVSIALTVGLAMLPGSMRLAGLALVTVVVAVLAVALYRLLHTKGAQLFRAL